MSLDTNTYDVYQGIWTDWSRGPVFGVTVTLSGRDGKLLLGSLAVFVKVVGVHAWRLAHPILSLYTCSSREPREDTGRVSLRGGRNPEAAPRTLADAILSRKENARRTADQLLPRFGPILACVVGFVAAGGFSSRAVPGWGSSPVQLSGRNCGRISWDPDPNAVQDTMAYLGAQGLHVAENYARQCYLSPPAGKAMSCNTYLKKHIAPAILDANASCPFDRKACKRSTGNLYLDTGLLDSHDDYGRNSPPNQRMQLRRTVHCAPLATTDGYRVQRFDEAHNRSYTEYYYGSEHDPYGADQRNFTAQFSSDMYAYPDVNYLVGNSGDTWDDFTIRYVDLLTSST